MRKKEALRREAGTRVASWIAATREVAAEDWTIVDDLARIPEHVLADSRYWCDHVFKRDANPHDIPSTVRATCASGRSPDLLRHTYAAKGLDLALLEGRNFLLVRVDRRSLDLLALPEDERPAAVARIAETLFREPLRFSHCEPLTEGALFCTDASADPLLIASWAERADGGVHAGELWFVCYKRIAQSVGFANPAQWFSDTACMKTRPRRRSRR